MIKRKLPPKDNTRIYKNSGITNVVRMNEKREFSEDDCEEIEPYATWCLAWLINAQGLLTTAPVVLGKFCGDFTTGEGSYQYPPLEGTWQHGKPPIEEISAHAGPQQQCTGSGTITITNTLTSTCGSGTPCTSTTTTTGGGCCSVGYLYLVAKIIAPEGSEIYWPDAEFPNGANGLTVDMLINDEVNGADGPGDTRMMRIKNDGLNLGESSTIVLRPEVNGEPLKPLIVHVCSRDTGTGTGTGYGS